MKSSRLQTLMASVTAAVIVLISLNAYAVPGFVPVQGHLADSAGVAIDSDTEMTFRLYSDASGTMTEIWSSTRTVTVQNGSFTVYLGTSTTLDLSLFRDNPEVMLGVTVGSDTEMPLIEVGSVPYAAVCEYSNSAGDAQTVAGMDPGELGPLGGLSCSDGQFASFSGGAWTCADAPTLTETEVDQFVANNDYVTSSSLSTVATSGSFADLANIPAGLGDGDDDTLGALSCANGQVALSNGTGWACGDLPTYTAAAPIVLNGNEFGLAADGVTANYIAADTITDAEIASSAGIAPSKIAGTAATLTGSQNFDSGTLQIDATNDRVGVGAAPTEALDVAGSARVTGEYRYDTVRTGAVQVSPMAFEITSATEDEEVSMSSFSGYLYISGGTATYGISMGAPVDLPHGATITDLTCAAYDSSATDDLSSDVDLRRRAITSTSGSTMATANLGSAAGTDSNAVYTGTDTTITGAVVDNSQYNYYLDLYFYTANTTGSSLRFYGCTISYETSRVLP